LHGVSPTTLKAKAAAPASRRLLYQALEGLMVRAPLLPVEEYLALGAYRIADAARLPLDARVRTALAVGGGHLYEALRPAEYDPALAGKLLRYLIRMSTRPTPYGLFAGVALARWGPETDLSFAAETLRTRTRPDMAWLLGFVLNLERQREVRTRLNYIANTRAFVHAGRIFLPERAPTADAGPGPPVSLRATGVARRALALARAPISHDRLVAQLSTMPGAAIDRIEKLIDELWQHTLLLTDLRPPLTLTKQSPAAYVAHRLRDIPAAADARNQLEQAIAKMAAWDELPAAEAAQAYRRLATHLDPDRTSSSEPAAQVDMALPLAATRITRAVAKEAARAAELLLRLTPVPSGPPHLDGYRRSFEARYGPNREVPLLEMLDANFGLGPPSPQFHGTAPAADLRKTAQRQQCLYDLAITALREQRLIVELDGDALARLETWCPSPSTAPRSLDLSLFVIAASAADMDEGRFQVSIGPNLGAAMAGRNLGRFADLLGDEAQALLHDVNQSEATWHPEGLRAEVVYLPYRFRSANVTVRPRACDYEIALGTSPGAPPDEVIPLDELVVGIRKGRFYVRWPARQMDVIGCASHMLNNIQAPDVCRFLDDLDRQGLAQLSSFDWGSAAGLPVLPRVQSGRVVLCPAQWRIEERARMQLRPDSPTDFAAALREWRTRWKVPRYVYLSVADNRLLLDLENEAQAHELRAELNHLKENAALVLQEALPAPEHAWAPGPGGHFLTELVVPLVLQAGQVRPGAALPHPCPVTAPAAADRLRAPGSDWLFAKLYSPRLFEDDLLTGPVAEVCQQAIDAGEADYWFFVRYSDPDSHLRVRFHGHPERLVGQLIQRLCSWADHLMVEGLCTRVCFDTYDRELERYGGVAGTEAAEAIFAADSRAVVEMLRLSGSGLLGMDMTSLAVLSVDQLLAGLGLSTTERVAWCRTREAAKTASGQEYRRRKEEFRRLLGDPEYVREKPGGDALARILATRSKELAPIGRELDALEDRGELGQRKADLIGSYVHLHCNRLLASNWSLEELVVGLLGRTRQGLNQSALVPGHA
jgi:thiopeptide-type bacteriocin biosynthesis protein